MALISEAGLPGVSDPGQRLIAAARAAGVRVEVIPGPCAALTALVGSGLPSDRFLFIGFLPRRPGPQKTLLHSLAGESGTLIFYEAPDRVPKTLAALAECLGASRRACVARELTKLYEEYATGTLAELVSRYAEVPPRGEVTIVVSGFDPATDSASDQAGDSAGAASFDVEAEIRERLRSGQRPREIAAALSLRSGYPRRKLYQLALSLAERDQDPEGDNSSSRSLR